MCRLLALRLLVLLVRLLRLVVIGVHLLLVWAAPSRWRELARRARAEPRALRTPARGRAAAQLCK